MKRTVHRKTKKTGLTGMHRQKSTRIRTGITAGDNWLKQLVGRISAGGY